MRLCFCVTVVLSIGSIFLFIGSDDDALLDDHHDAMGYDPGSIRWESDFDE